jgi:hypothetical protein
MQCFPPTGRCLTEHFLAYWQQHGALAVFGMPITFPLDKQIGDTGTEHRVQWLERTRFERHPALQPPYDVLLGRLGVEALLQQGIKWQELPKATPGKPHYFKETGHAIDPQFWEYWRNHGLEFDGRQGTSVEEALALFGYPISEPAMETNSSGDIVLTQWFERVRFEYHPTNDVPFRVLLGRLGAEVGGWKTVKWQGLIIPIPPDGEWKTYPAPNFTIQGAPVIALRSIRYFPPDCEVECPSGPSFYLLNYRGSLNDWMETARQEGIGILEGTERDISLAGYPAKVYQPGVTLCNGAIYIADLPSDQLLYISNECLGQEPYDSVIRGLRQAE